MSKHKEEVIYNPYIEVIYNPYITEEEINEIFENLLNQQEGKDLLMNIDFYQEKSPTKSKRCLNA